MRHKLPVQHLIFNLCWLKSSLQSIIHDSFVFAFTTVLILGFTFSTTTRAQQTFTVNSTADDSDPDLGKANDDKKCGTGGAGCTLRAAIENHNANRLTANKIGFNIPPGPGLTIKIDVLTPLPTVLGTVNIDGTTQPGYKPLPNSPVIQIDGTNAKTPVFPNIPVTGFHLAGESSKIKGLEIVGFSGRQILIQGTGGNSGKHIIEANVISDAGRGEGGILIDAGDYEASDNQILRNNLFSNKGPGIQINEKSTAPGSKAKNNNLEQNTLGFNTGLGIDLTIDGATGVTANDPPANRDADNGPNELQNFPEIVSSSTVKVVIELNSKANSRYRIDLYYNNQCHASGNGEGEVLINPNPIVVTTDAGGRVRWEYKPARKLVRSTLVTATATEITGGKPTNTSEFSRCREVLAAASRADLQLFASADKPSVQVGGSLTFSIKLTNEGPDAATGISVAYKVPAGLTVNQITSSAGSYDANTGLWTVSSLASGSDAVLTVVGIATQVGTLLNTAEIMEVTTDDQEDPDSDPGNGDPNEDDQSSVSIQVQDANTFTFYRDGDNDGYGDAGNTVVTTSPTPPPGYVNNNVDCDDTKTTYADNDGDGYGAGPAAPCGLANNADCNDNNAAVHPGAIACPAAAVHCINGSGTYTVVPLNTANDCGVSGVGYTVTGATNRSGSGNDASGAFNPGTSTITWTVTHTHSPLTTCQSTVTVGSGVIAVSIPDTKALSSGVNVNTVYIGYAPASSLTLTAQASGNGGGLTYLWNTGAVTQSVTVSPTITTTYTVTVTGGCTGTASKTVAVADVRCGNKLDKVSVCHKDKNAMCIGREGVADHLGHGDYLGSCNGSNTTSRATGRVPKNNVVKGEQTSKLAITAFPNPSHGSFDLQIGGNGLAEKVTLRISDAVGRTVEIKSIAAGSTLRLGKRYLPGVYVAEVVQGREKATLKLVKVLD